MDNDKTIITKSGKIKLECETSKGTIYKLKDNKGMLIAYIAETEDAFIVSCKKGYKNIVEEFILDTNENRNKKILLFQSYKIEVLNI